MLQTCGESLTRIFSCLWTIIPASHTFFGYLVISVSYLVPCRGRLLVYSQFWGVHFRNFYGARWKKIILHEMKFTSHPSDSSLLDISYKYNCNRLRDFTVLYFGCRCWVCSFCHPVSHRYLLQRDQCLVHLLHVCFHEKFPSMDRLSEWLEYWR